MFQTRSAVQSTLADLLVYISSTRHLYLYLKLQYLPPCGSFYSYCAMHLHVLWFCECYKSQNISTTRSGRQCTAQCTAVMFAHCSAFSKFRHLVRPLGVFIVECGIARFLCAMRVFKVWHHLHPLVYLCAKFRFFRGLHCSASSWRKIA